LLANGELTAAIVEQLTAAYVFLRNLEHRLQYLDDQQTQDIPESAEDRALLAAGMGYADYATLLAELDKHRKLVSAQFEKIFSASEAESGNADIWRDDTRSDDLAARLKTLDYQQEQASAERLLQLRTSHRYLQLPELSRQRVDRLIPQFIQLCAQQNHPDITLARMLTLLDSIVRRSAYVAFLTEYPLALQRLCSLVSASSWAAEYMALHPALFDELLDARELYQTPDWSQINVEIAAQLAEHGDDIERQMDSLRHAQQAQIFHLLAMDTQGFLPLETLSDHLSALADLMLHHVLAICWQHARKKHCAAPAFAIIAYGKLGGKELGYESDLDLIFIYDDDHPDAPENYARLAQRINTVLGSYTPAGRLYETDLRLRPNGSSGLLVTSLAAFSEYQLKQAWVWEHQALTRARFCAGDAAIGASFERVRTELLCLARDLPALRQEILGMRQKMHDGHANPSELFDIKHDTGGMVDIEFMVQYLVLAHARLHPELSKNIGNLALLKLAGELRLIPPDLAAATGNLYRTLRKTQHRLRLNHQTPCRVPFAEVDRQASLALWDIVFAEATA
jgi:glutamate-ammonia-ligase adenylyltransferase